MDTPRRWQIASAATAIAGLGVGGLLVGRHSSEPVESIDLEQVAVTGPSVVQEPSTSDDEREIVAPRVLEASPPVSADDAGDPAEDDGDDGPAGTSGSASPDDAPASADDAEPDDGGDSAASVESAD